LTGAADFESLFKEYDTVSRNILENINDLENKLSELKADISVSVKKRIIDYYNA